MHLRRGGVGKKPSGKVGAMPLSVQYSFNLLQATISSTSVVLFPACDSGGDLGLFEY